MDYKKGLIVSVILDLILLILVAVGGLRVYQLFNQNTSSSAKPIVLVESLPAVTSVNIPETIKAGVDFSLILTISNPNPVPIHIREVILPRLIVDSMTVVSSDPQVATKDKYDVGEGYPVDFNIPPGGKQSVTFVIQPSKMQSVNAEMMTYTDNFIIPTLVQFVVTP